MLLHDPPRRLYRLFLISGTLVTVFAVFSTRNRSGWLGVLVIAAMLGFSALRRARNVVLLSGLIAAGVLLVDHFGNTPLIEERIEVTQDGYTSDAYRIWIIQSSIKIGLENPLIGVSPQQLPREIAMLGASAFSPSTHNVFALMFGGGGFVLIGVALLFGLGLWYRPAWGAAPYEKEARVYHNLLRATVFLWCLRGMFTDEILYSPSFSLALGLCVGACVFSGVWSIESRR